MPSEDSDQTAQIGRQVGIFTVRISQMVSFLTLQLYYSFSLRKQAYSNILRILPPKIENFQIKILIFFYISAQNIDCGYMLELPQ